MAKRVMILATNGFEQSELFDPKKNLEDAGIETELVSLESGEIKAWDKDDWGKTIKVDKTVDEVANCEGYDALLLPGGQINPDLLRVNDRGPFVAGRIIDISRRSRAQLRPEASEISAPSKRIEPPEAFFRPISVRAMVDLPDPLSPTRPSVSPG